MRLTSKGQVTIPLAMRKRYGLDPLAILVPFLVFAIGVSHGVQQINAISKAVAGGADSMEAARESFSSLFIPARWPLLPRSSASSRWCSSRFR